MRTLVVEDEVRLARHVSRALTNAGHETAVVHDGETALADAKKNPYELIILDVMLPGIDGFEVLRRLRKAHVDSRVLILTARGELNDRVNGLNAGGDDYLTKPFSFRELVARLRALARRPPELLHRVRQIADLTVDLDAHTAVRDGEAIPLTAQEWALLEFFVRHEGSVVDRSSITAYVWDENHDPFTNLLEVLICRLRKKIDEAHAVKLIHTVRGAGYRFGP